MKILIKQIELKKGNLESENLYVFDENKKMIGKVIRTKYVSTSIGGIEIEIEIDKRKIK